MFPPPSLTASRAIAGAVIPLMVMTTPAPAQCRLQDLLASDGARGDNYGSAVAIHGDDALVGAWQHSPDDLFFAGAAYVVRRSSATWDEVQKLVASDADAFANFGEAVAMDGAFAIVGASGADVAGSDSGAAYIFERVGETWTETAILSPDDATSFHVFGRSVAIAGDVALVSAEGDSEGGIGAGAVYVFLRSGSAWTQTAKLIASDAADFQVFGVDVGIDADGDDIIVGSTGGFDSPGAAYVFHADSGGWTEQARITPAIEGPDDYFGQAVAMRGDVALIAAGGRDERGIEDVGAVYAFTRSGTAWSEQQIILPSDPAEFMSFGTDVVIDGDRALIGAGPDELGEAAVYLERASADLWYEVAQIDDLNPSFGWSLDLDGPFGIAGAPRFGHGFATVFGSDLEAMPFTVDPDASTVNITVNVLGSEATVPAHMTGTALGMLIRSCTGFTSLQITELRLATLEEVLEIELMGGLIRGTLIGSTITLDGRHGMPGPPSAVDDTGSGEFDHYLIDMGGIVEYDILGNPGTFEFASISPTELIDGPFTLAESPAPGGGVTLTVPLENTFAIDLGLGELNPTFTIEGTLHGVETAACAADLDGDGTVGVSDLLAVLAAWGGIGGDVTGDGTTDVLDLLTLLAAWGTC